MKTSLNKPWLKVGLASLAVAVSAGLSYGQQTVTFTFNSSADVTPAWSDWGQTVPVKPSFIAGDAPLGQALSTGALGFNGTNYSPTATFGGIQVVFPSINVHNALNDADLSFWVKQEGTPDSNNRIQSIQIILANYGTSLYAAAPGPDQFTYQGPVATNGGWERFVIPISDFPQQDKLNSVNRILLGVYDGAYSTPTPMNIAFDNISFDNIPEPSSLALLAFGVVGLGLTTWNRRKLVG